MYLKPSEIFFSQDSINNVFDKRCVYSYKPIGETLDALCEGRCSILDIPTITVVQQDGKWVTADNRRLWVFREMERVGKCETIPVKKGYYIPSAKMTSDNGGTSVHVRGRPGGFWHNKPSAPKPRASSSSSRKYQDTRTTSQSKQTTTLPYVAPTDTYSSRSGSSNNSYVFDSASSNDVPVYSTRNYQDIRTTSQSKPTMTIPYVAPTVNTYNSRSGNPYNSSYVDSSSSDNVPSYSATTRQPSYTSTPSIIEDTTPQRSQTGHSRVNNEGTRSLYRVQDSTATRYAHTSPVTYKEEGGGNACCIIL